MEVFSIFFFPCAMIVSIVWLNCRERLIRYRIQADLYALTLEKGHSVTLPEGILTESEKKRGGGSLKAGMICIAVGAAVALGFWLAGYSIGNSDMHEAKEVSQVFMLLAHIGILPFMIGVAFMIIHFFEKKRDAAGKAQ